MPVDEATATFLAAASGGKPMHAMAPDEARALTAQLAELYGPGPEVGSVENLTLAVDGGSIDVRVLRPVAAPRALIVYYHGGGWALGHIDEFDTAARRLVNATDATVILVNYRLAPEYPAPTAVEDSWLALEWAAASRAKFAGDVPLIVMGDSAGGNLAAVLAQRAMRYGAPDLALQVLVYPVTDANFDTASYTDPANQLLLSRDGMIWFWDHYAPDTSLRDDPELSPLRAADVSAVAPAVVVTAEFDPLRDDGENYVARLRESGVSTDHRRFEGQMHGFFTMVNVLPGADAGLDYVAERIDAVLSAR